MIGVDGIKVEVEAISTEQAEGYGDELAPKGVDGDADPKYESDIAYRSVFVIDNSQSPSLALSTQQSPKYFTKCHAQLKAKHFLQYQHHGKRR